MKSTMEESKETNTDWKKLLNKPKLSKKDKQNIVDALKEMGISTFFPTNQPIKKQSLERYIGILDKAQNQPTNGKD